MEKTANLSSASSPLERPKSQNGRGIVRSTRRAGDPLTPDLLKQLERLKAMRDDEIDFSDIPATTPDFWRRAAQQKTLERTVLASAPLIAKRHLVLLKGDIRSGVDIEIGPVREHADAASCHIRIVGDEGEIEQDIFGIDGVQALQLALRFAGSELDRLGGNGWQHDEKQGHGFESFPDLEKAS